MNSPRWTRPGRRSNIAAKIIPAPRDSDRAANRHGLFTYATSSDFIESKSGDAISRVEAVPPTYPSPSRSGISASTWDLVA